MNKDMFITIATVIDNNCDHISSYLSELTSVLVQHYENYEIILIGNGITIQTSMVLCKLIQKYQKTRVIQLANHYDDDIAYSVALDSAIGDAVILMDSRQDPCETIPQLVNKVLKENIDIAIGNNLDKKEELFWCNFLAKSFYKLSRYMCSQSADFDRTHFSCYSRTAVNSITQHKNHIRNLRLLRNLLGVETSTIDYRMVNRGEFRPNINILGRFFSRIEEVFSLSVKPLRIVSALCLTAGILNTAYIFYAIVIRLFSHHVTPGWASLAVTQGSVFALFFFSLGIIANYLNIIFRETQQRPLYTILNEWSSSTPLDSFLRKNVVE